MCVSPPQKIFQLGDLRTSISEFIVVLICTSVSNPGPQNYFNAGLLLVPLNMIYTARWVHMGPAVIS